MIIIVLFQLIRQLPNLGEKNKEMPLCHLYSIKARALIHAHLSRIPVNPETLDKDRQYIVKKCPYLIQEMVTCVNQVILLAYARRGAINVDYYLDESIHFQLFFPHSSENTLHQNH